MTSCVVHQRLLSDWTRTSNAAFTAWRLTFSVWLEFDVGMNCHALL